MARTKHVFPYNELAKVWLRQSQAEGHSPGERMYFRDSTIYSYGQHFPIAKIAVAPNGEEVIFFTTATYSSTTVTHISVVGNAVRHSSRRIVYCYDPIAGSLSAMNLDAFYQGIKEPIAKHAKARKPELYSGEILRIVRQCQEYCEVMLLPVPMWAQIPQGIEPGAPLKAALKFHMEGAVT